MVTQRSTGHDQQADGDRACPVSGAPSGPVGLRTVKSLLTPDALGRVSRLRHFFCTDPGCDTVYFDEDNSCFARRDLRVPVAQKEPQGRRPVCYCFAVTEADILAEMSATGQSTVVERVREHVAAGRCACDLRNPSGKCCLPALLEAVTRLGGTRR